jgi:S-methylmethionine-dependent homocysteine/selenocysteine methylase
MAKLLDQLLKRSRPVLLDGATGTELLRRGVRTGLPLWSAHALADRAGLEILTAIHKDYARAGAEILVTNTFRTSHRTLDRAGCAGNWERLNRRAVEAAREGAEACGSERALVAGGLAPLEDCYRPDLAPDEETCYREHRRQAELLTELGVDLIFVETVNCAREATGAVRACTETGLPVLISLCPKPPAHLLSGDALEDVVPRLIDLGGENLGGILLNCATPDVMDACYPKLIAFADGIAHGIYPHMGQPDDAVGWKLPKQGEPVPLAERLLPWLDRGSHFIGGCCGTTPRHIEALRQGIDRREARR